MSPFRKRLLVTVCAAAAVLAVPAMALAQNGPPSPPIGLVHGTVDGATVGQKVVLFVHQGGTSVHCGLGEVLEGEGGAVSYTVDIESANRYEGCAEPGDTLSLWFVPEGDQPGGSSEFIQLPESDGSGGPSFFVEIEHDVTLSEPSNRLVTPGISGNVE